MKKRKKYEPLAAYALAWSTGGSRSGMGWITSVCSLYKFDCKKRVETLTGRKWEDVYKQGGRIVKVKITYEVT